MKRFDTVEILAMTFLLAFCSIVYELLLANTLGIMTGSYIFWQSITIGVYIGGLGLGTALAGRDRKPLEELYRVEWVLSVLGGLCVVFLYFAHGGQRSTDYLFFLQNEFFSPAYLQQSAFLKFLFTLLVQSLTFFIGFFSGFEIPLLMKTLEERTGEAKDEMVLGLNYIGTLFGSLAFAFVFLPHFDVLLTSLIVGSFNLMICFYLIARRLVKLTPSKALSGVVSLGLLSAVALNTYEIEQAYLKTYYMFKRYASNPSRMPLQFFSDLHRFEDIERIKSRYQYIDIYEPEWLSDEVILAIDTNFQFSSRNERTYHEAFAHIPISMTGKTPKRVLVLGGGDGLLKRELIKHREIEEIIHIELDDKILELAREDERFTTLNENSFLDPRITTIAGDAFYYLRNNHETFDAIFIDFPYPNNYNLSRLYSIEFYRYVKASLAPDGFVVLDAPLQNHERFVPSHLQGTISIDSVFRDRDRVSNSVLLSTAFYAGFPQLFPYKVGEEAFLLMGDREKTLNYEIDEVNLDYYQAVKPNQLREIMRQEFPHRISESYINSIFRPRVLSIAKD